MTLTYQHFKVIIIIIIIIIYLLPAIGWSPGGRSCVVVDLWQSLSEWHLLLSACVLVCRRENVGA